MITKNISSETKRLSLLVATALFLSSCSSGPTLEEEAERADDAESNVAYLQNKLEKLSSQMSGVETAQSELSSAVDRFGYEDWTTVVPDVQNAKSDLETAISEMRNQIDQ
jgi:outer membrane murein-binding lipoprotein Lpp